MADYKFGIGQEFADVKTFRKTIKEVAIAQHFELKIIKSDMIRYFATCAKEGCPWCIRAVKLPNSPVFTIRSFEGTHTCGKDAQFGHHQASVDWIVNFIEDRLRKNMNYKPKDILEDIQKQYGIMIPYKQAWRAKERCLANIYGSSEEGYSLLPGYCDQIKSTNPGSVAQVSTAGPDQRFQSVFISFSASIYGFTCGCLPVVSVGRLQLKSKYLGTLLSVTSFDADGGLFPVAFGIVDTETDDRWMWFLSEFHKLLEANMETIPQLTFLSDGHKGIADAVKRKFPSAHHGVCVRHLAESMGKYFKNSTLVNLLWKAACSVTTTIFRERMTEMEAVCADAAKWIQEIPPSRWAVVHFEGPRFGHISSNTEEFNKWILKARELPIIQVIECIHKKLMTEFNERRENAEEWMSELTPSAEKRVSEAMASATNYQALRSDDVEFEVLSAEHSNIVNIGTRCCSCREWQLYGVPCSHAVASILSCKKNVYDYIDKCFTAARYRKTYCQTIHPIPGKCEWSKIDLSTMTKDSKLVRPPKFRRPPGRPEKRFCSQEVVRGKHTVHCSKCNQTGHYKRTCKADSILRMEGLS